jgi:Patatin-like phospholipase
VITVTCMCLLKITVAFQCHIGSPRIHPYRYHSDQLSILHVVPLADEDKKQSKTTGDTKDGGDDSSAKETGGTAPPMTPLLDWTASGTIGSLLMQMQRKEEEMRKLNKTLLDEEQFLDLSPNNSTLKSPSVAKKTTTNSTDSSSTNMKSTNNDATAEDEQQNTAAKLTRRLRLTRSGRRNRVPNQDELRALMHEVQRTEGGSGGSRQDNSNGEKGTVNEEDLSVTSPMDANNAKELDDAVSIRISSSLKDVTILDLPELYQILRDPNENIASTEVAISPPKMKGKTKRTKESKDRQSDNLPQLSRQDHYEDRIGRDMRLIAVSIASSINSVDEWRLYCQQSTGGIIPLVECIRTGARSIREGGDLTQPGFDNLGAVPRKEESFLAAVSTCRALRDLCALSLDLAAVITDDLLRANAASRSKGDPSLLDDLCTILAYADDLGDITPKRRKQRLLSLRRRYAEGKSPKLPHIGLPHRPRKETRLQCKLYVTQLLLAMTCASDSAVDAIRNTEGLQKVLLSSSSYARKQRRRRWLRYPGEMIKYVHRRSRKVGSDPSTAQSVAENVRRPFIEAASLTNDMNGRIQGVANQVLAAIGYNEWVPKIPGQKGLRILCLDGGGSRGMTSVVALKCLVDALGGVEVADCFDLVVGTSTGAIIAFLVGLNLETSEQAVERYDVLIRRIFTKSAFSTPMMLFTTASYDEAPFMNVLSEILGDQTMLDSRANPAVPFVFAVTSKMRLVLRFVIAC